MTKLVEPDPWQALRRFTPARIALGRVGVSLPTEEVLQFGLAHARARDAVWEPLDVESVVQALRAMAFATVVVQSAVPDRATYLRRPDWGRRLAAESQARLAALRGEPLPDLVLVVADGLSAPAVHRHAVALLARLCPELKAAGWRIAPVVIAEQSRVALERISVASIAEVRSNTGVDGSGAIDRFAQAGGERLCGRGTHLRGGGGSLRCGVRDGKSLAAAVS